MLHLPRARDCQDAFSGDGFVVVPDCVTRQEAASLVDAARRVAGSAAVSIQPMLGYFVLMDGSRCGHGVEPLRRPALRLTMPMVFPALHVERPEGLDEYLYGA